MVGTHLGYSLNIVGRLSGAQFSFSGSLNHFSDIYVCGHAGLHKATTHSYALPYSVSYRTITVITEPKSETEKDRPQENTRKGGRPYAMFIVSCITFISSFLEV